MEEVPLLLRVFCSWSMWQSLAFNINEIREVLGMWSCRVHPVRVQLPHPAPSKRSSHPRIDLEIHLRVYWLGPNILSKPLPQFSHKAECKLCGCRELFSIVTCPRYAAASAELVCPSVYFHSPKSRRLPHTSLDDSVSAF